MTIGTPQLTDDATPIVAAAFTRFGKMIDSRDWEAWAQLFSPDGLLVVPFFEDPLQRSAMAGAVETALGSFKLTQHLIVNHQARRDGDDLLIAAEVLATHIHMPELQKRHWTVGGHYEGRLQHGDSGWQFARLELTVLWEDGDGPF
jgi:hypothetical protein